ncbi:MAG: S8 family serine peptidase [Acidobacteriia bacterium]|nr:S8 family serine peptidase [Terriglobia bacterium]
MLEIVHDLAPGAQLLFANFETSQEFNNAVNFLSENADVVVDDIQFVALPPLILGAMPYDGTSAVSINTANAFNNNANPIRARFVIPSNFAGAHYREEFFDSGVDGAPIVGLPGNLHLFQRTASTSDVLGLGPTVTDQIHLPAGESVVVSLIWNDPLGASNNDYDLFLLRSGIFGCLNFPDVVAWSIDTQNGTQDPVEVLRKRYTEVVGYTNDTGADDDFCIVIQNSENTAGVRNFNMFVQAPSLPSVTTGETHNYNTIRSSITAPGDAGGSPVSVITVGAANWETPDLIEPFSGNGPTTDGRMKPDVTAIDRVSITGAGGFNPWGTLQPSFPGTSAASPHSAGVAALLLEAAPCLRAGATGGLSPVNARTNLRNLILNNAVDLGAAGPDNVFGYGRIDALAAANRTIPAANAGPSQTVSGTSASGASVTLNGSSSSDPVGCPLAFSWTGSCGNASAVSPTVTCPFGTNNQTLTVTNNGVTLSQAASVQITVSNFTVGVSPSSVTVSRGQSATYTLSVNPQYGAFTNAVSLACSNLPSRSACSFSPSSVTPGASGATSNLTISTTAASASFKDPFGPPPLYGLWIGLMALSLIALAGIRRFARTRARALYVSAGLLGLLLALQVACGGGGGGGGGPTNPGTPVGTYTITIAGTAGSLQNSGTVTLTVQ